MVTDNETILGYGIAWGEGLRENDGPKTFVCNDGGCCVS